MQNLESILDRLSAALAILAASSEEDPEATLDARRTVAQTVIAAINGDEAAAHALFFYLHRFQDIILGAVIDTLLATGLDEGVLARVLNPFARAIAFHLLPASSPVWLELFQSSDREAREHALTSCPESSPAWAALAELPGGPQLINWARSRRGSPCRESPWARAQREAANPPRPLHMGGHRD